MIYNHFNHPNKFNKLDVYRIRTFKEVIVLELPELKCVLKEFKKIKTQKGYRPAEVIFDEDYNFVGIDFFNAFDSNKNFLKFTVRYDHNFKLSNIKYEYATKPNNYPNLHNNIYFEISKNIDMLSTDEELLIELFLYYDELCMQEHLQELYIYGVYDFKSVEFRNKIDLALMSVY